MDPKVVLKNNIKEWIKYDSEIKNLQKLIKERRDKKKILTENLISVMKDHEIDCFDVNDGKILFTKNKVKAPLNKNNIIIALSKYFDNDDSVNINDIGKFIIENREITIKENIKKK